MLHLFFAAGAVGRNPLFYLRRAVFRDWEMVNGGGQDSNSLRPPDGKRRFDILGDKGMLHGHFLRMVFRDDIQKMGMEQMQTIPDGEPFVDMDSAVVDHGQLVPVALDDTVTHRNCAGVNAEYLHSLLSGSLVCFSGFLGYIGIGVHVLDIVDLFKFFHQL